MARNVRVGRGEIDLVVRFGPELAVVEVKTSSMSNSALDDPVEAFTPQKALQVGRLARTLGIGRVDLVAVAVGEEGVDVRWIPRVT